MLIGCDYGRSGIYKITFEPGINGIPERLESNARQRLIDAIRFTLTDNRYKLWTGKDTFWAKGGSRVEWKTNSESELLIQVSGFGSKSTMRDSLEIELKLLRLITANPDARIYRYDPDFTEQ